MTFPKHRPAGNSNPITTADLAAAMRMCLGQAAMNGLSIADYFNIRSRNQKFSKSRRVKKSSPRKR